MFVARHAQLNQHDEIAIVSKMVTGISRSDAKEIVPLGRLFGLSLQGKNTPFLRKAKDAC
jgi:hypothetical protein